MDIIGTNNGETIPGTELADIIQALGGNDIVNALGGDDTIFGGLGADQLFGGEGNDTFVQDQPTTFVAGNATTPVQREVFDGGNGFDTIELRTIPNPIASAGGPIHLHVLQTGALVSIEQLRFASQAGEIFQAQLGFNQVAASGLTTIQGGAGTDLLLLVVNAGGNYTVPGFTLTGSWSPAALNAWQFSGDTITVSAQTGAAVNITATDLDATQRITGGAGNDVLTGSARGDVLNGGAGINQLFGGEGNDSLVIVNSNVPLIVNGQSVVQNGVLVGMPTNFTGLGSTYDGGDGIDVLSVGGNVIFQGTLNGIEGINLLPALGNPMAAGSLLPAYLEMDLAHFAMLPTAAFFRGVGTVDPDLNEGQSFDFSRYVIEPGSSIVFLFDGESDSPVPGVTVTWVGTSTTDFFDFGSDYVIATGGPGADVFELDEGSGEVTDFTIGQDRVDVSETGITGFGRLADFITQVGADVVIGGSSGGESVSLTLRGINLTSLTAADFLFDQGGYQVIETEGDTDDLLFGFALNDQLSGGGGNDRLYGGGGIDKLFGGDGNDTLILDRQVGPNNPMALFAAYNGGVGDDTLLLRTPDNGPANLVYNFIGAAVSGNEHLRFDSRADTQLQAVFQQQQLADSGIVEVVGGAGKDLLVSVAPTAGTYTTPLVALSNWNYPTNPSPTNGDVVVLVAGAAGNFVLNARDDYQTIQALVGGMGNDTLNGSNGVDALNGGAGNNSLFGNGGNDLLTIANTSQVVSQGGMLVKLAPTTLTGAGSLFDGGTGTQDSLGIGGLVNFQGTLANIEGVTFLDAQPVIASGLPAQDAARLLITGTTLAVLPHNAFFAGTGTMAVDVAPGESYDGSGYRLAPGANVTIEIKGSDPDDTIKLGALTEEVDGDDGTDTAVFAGNRASYTFGVGANGEVLIGNDVLNRIELFRFDDGLFGFDGVQLVPIPEGTSGSVADGYIAGATVWIDVDGDGVLDPDEPFAISDATGRFTIASTATGALRATGGTNIDTGLANTLLLSAPDGAGVINPLTTLIENLIADGASAAEAEAAVETAFGLDPDLDLTQLDLIAAAATDPAALEAQKAAATVAEVIGAVVENGGNQADALAALAGLIGDAGDVGGTVDLTAADTLTTVIGAGLPGEDVTDLVEDTQAVAEAIDAAKDLDDVTEVQGNTAPTAADDLAALDEDATVTGNVIVGSDSDPDLGQVLSVTAVNGAALTGQPIRGLYGTLTIAADGSYSYAADADVVDAFAPGTHLTESFAYAIGDGTGGIASATLSFDITTIDDNRTLTGGNGADTLSGTGRDDILFGGRGDDVLAGSGGADRLYGGQGADRLSGGDGFDLLVGGQGGDILRGDGGNDVLIGGKGGDVLTGGGGADVFDFSRLDGTDRDVITDFEVGVDSIHLGAGLTVTGTSQSGASTVLALSNGGSILLQGVHADSLDGLFSADLPDWTAGLPLI